MRMLLRYPWLLLALFLGGCGGGYQTDVAPPASMKNYQEARK